MMSATRELTLEELGMLSRHPENLEECCQALQIVVAGVCCASFMMVRFTLCHVGAQLGLPSETLRGCRSRRWSSAKKSPGRRMKPPDGLLPTLGRSSVRILRPATALAPVPVIVPPVQRTRRGR
ncbi:hypothetical protein MRX96_021594 [Rhipicephalus microplus]